MKKLGSTQIIRCVCVDRIGDIHDSVVYVNVSEPFWYGGTSPLKIISYILIKYDTD